MHKSWLNITKIVSTFYIISVATFSRPNKIKEDIRQWIEDTKFQNDLSQAINKPVWVDLETCSSQYSSNELTITWLAYYMSEHFICIWI